MNDPLLCLVIGWVAWPLLFVLAYALLVPDQRRGNPSSSDADLYCGTCEWVYGQVDNLLTGRRFECPEAHLETPHVAAAIPAEDLRGWMWSSTKLIRYMDIRRRPAHRVLLWKGAITLALGVLLLALALHLATSQQRVIRWAACLLAGIVFLDMLALNTATAFVTQKPRLPLRTALFAIVALAQLAASFAVVYASMRGMFEFHGRTVDLTPVRAFYFSLTTLATVGYGDITPINEALPSAIVAAEIVCGLFFLGVILATFVSWATGGASLPTIDDLIKESERIRCNRRWARPQGGGA
jgi:voltage-gated potassium channel